MSQNHFTLGKEFMFPLNLSLTVAKKGGGGSRPCIFLMSNIGILEDEGDDEHEDESSISEFRLKIVR